MTLAEGVGVGVQVDRVLHGLAGGNGLGVFYWEPESYGNWQGYGLGAFDNTGKPTVAMNAFMN